MLDETPIQMRVISKPKLRGASAKYPDAKVALDSWYKTAQKSTWTNLLEVQKTYSSAEAVGNFTVFNIKGNKYRLIVSIDYQRQTIFIKYILTHAGYDKDGWKNDPYY